MPRVRRTLAHWTGVPFAGQEEAWFGGGRAFFFNCLRIASVTSICLSQVRTSV
ncbi:MAG: hypothetical protein ABSC06_37855 [Rhodopila sp.]